MRSSGTPRAFAKLDIRNQTEKMKITVDEIRGNRLLCQGKGGLSELMSSEWGDIYSVR